MTRLHKSAICIAICAWPRARPSSFAPPAKCFNIPGTTVREVGKLSCQVIVCIVDCFVREPASVNIARGMGGCKSLLQSSILLGSWCFC